MERTREGREPEKKRARERAGEIMRERNHDFTSIRADDRACSSFEEVLDV